MWVTAWKTNMCDNTKLKLLLDIDEMAEVLYCSKSKLEKQRLKNAGPPWFRDGKKYYYPIEGAKEYVRKHTYTPGQQNESANTDSNLDNNDPDNTA